MVMGCIIMEDDSGQHATRPKIGAIEAGPCYIEVIGMKINRRVFIESIVVSILISLTVLGWEITRGYYTTQKYVPEIVNSYESIDYLQHKVSFGIVGRSGWITILWGMGGFLLLAITYYGIRTWLTKLKNK